MAINLEELKARIKKPQARKQWNKILLYGPAGVGKTSLYYDAKDTLVLDVEYGTNVLKRNNYYLPKDYDSPVQVLQLESWADLQGVFMLLQSGELKFTNIILDSLTDIRELCKDYVLETENRKRISDDVPSQQDWGVVAERMKKMIRNFKTLDANIILIAREYTYKDDVTGETFVRPAIGGKLEDDLPGMMDIVGYMNVTREGERAIWFDLTGRYYAKDRTNRLPKIIKNPTWADFEKALPELVPESESEAVKQETA